MSNKSFTKEQLTQVANQMARFTVPRAVKINQAFFNKLVEDGTIEVKAGKAEAFGSFNALPVIIDNSVSTFEFEY